MKRQEIIDKFQSWCMSNECSTDGKLPDSYYKQLQLYNLQAHRQAALGDDVDPQSREWLDTFPWVQGPTFALRRELQQLGAKWCSARKCWIIDASDFHAHEWFTEMPRRHDLAPLWDKIYITFDKKEEE